MKVKKGLAVLLCMLLTLSSLASCGGAGESTEIRQTESGTVSEKIPAVLNLVANGKTDFKIIIPEKTSAEMTVAIQNLYKAFENYAGINMEIDTDWIRAGDEHDPDSFEILIGNTNYKQTHEALAEIKYYDYVIRASGNKLVIAGNVDEKTVQALNYFINNFIKNKISGEKTLVFSEEDNFRYKFNYKIEEFVISGMPAEKFQIVIPQNANIGATRCARIIYNHILKYYGKKLNIVTDEKEETACEILIGNTSRKTVSAGAFEYRITAEDTKLILSAESIYAYEAAAKTFTEKIAPAASGNVAVSDKDLWTEDVSLSMKNGTQNLLNDNGDLRVIFSNIYGYSFDNHPIEQRLLQLGALYSAYSADIIALQECSPYARSGGLAEVLKSYGYEEVPASGSAVNYTPIFYDSKNYEVVACGFEKFSDGMKDDTKSYTWAVFRDLESGKIFSVVSTHFCYTLESAVPGSDAARQTDARQLIACVDSIIGEYNCPVFAGGDLNSNSGTAAYKLIAEKYSDTQKTARETEDISTHHAYPYYSAEQGIYLSGDKPTQKYEYAIDHVFFTGTGVDIDIFDIITDDYSILSSDHCPLFIQISFN